MENIELFKKLLENFDTYLSDNQISWKIITLDNVNNFYDHIEWVVIEDTKTKLKREPKFIENKQLMEFSKQNLANYNNFEIYDLYKLLPQIFLKIYNYLIWDKENINVDYYHYITWYDNFIPNSPKVSNFSDLYNNDCSLAIEITERVLSKIDKEFGEFQFVFTFEFNFINYEKNKDLRLDNNIHLKIDKEWKFTIKWSYQKWYFFEKLSKAQKDIQLIFNILELQDILTIKDTDKRFWNKKYFHNHNEGKKILFSYNDKFNQDNFQFFLHVWDHLSRFLEIKNGNINLDYFNLLSDKFSSSSLLNVSNFFWTENYRFTSKKFLEYRMSIEIMLWSPQNDIKKTLKHTFSLFFPKEENMIEKFWKIRNKVVHEWKLFVNNDELNEIEHISKNLYLKLILAQFS